MNPPPPRSSRRRNNTFVVLGVLGVAALVLALVAYVLFQIAGPAAQRLRARNGTPLPPLVLSDLGGWRGRERVTVLLLGIDQRPNEDPANTRTDTMIILTLDPVARTAGMLSIPRDLYVPLPDRGQDRINTAHVYGGPQYAMKAVEYNFGIPIQHYMRVNFSAPVALIDLAGGIDIVNEHDINDPRFPDDNYGYAPFRLAAGPQHLDGAAALKYARTRHGDSDFYRIRRQQQVIMALRGKLTGTDMVTKLLPNAPTILQTLSESVSTDLSNTEIVQLALLARDIPVARIARLAVDERAVKPWTTPSGGQVEIPDRERLAELRAQLLNPAAPGATAENGRLALQNGTKTPGLAAAAKSALEAKGYAIAAIGDSPQDAPRTLVIDKTGKRAFAERVAKDLGLAGVVVITAIDPSSPVDVVVVLGDDYPRPVKP